MSCNCKHCQQEIEDGYSVISKLRDLFISRMTVDSETNDRRRKEYNQAIFHYYEDTDIDGWNKNCEKYGLSKKERGQTYPVWDEIDMDMVLRCFDDAVKDWRKTFCDVKDCHRK